MSFFRWSDELNVGVGAMNDEHKGLLRAMEELYVRSHAGAEKPELLRLVDHLSLLTSAHFDHEERYMASIFYPRLETHRAIHRQLLENLQTHRQTFLATPGGLSQEFFTFLRLWLSAHIKGLDRKYGDYAARRVALTPAARPPSVH